MTTQQLAVALLSHSWDPTTGAGKCAVELRSILASEASVRLVLEDSAVCQESSKVVKLWRKLRRSATVSRLLRREEVDVVIVNTTVQSTLVVAARLAGTRVVWWCHESGSSLTSPLMRIRVRIYRALCDRSVVVTRAAPPGVPRPVLIRNRVDSVRESPTPRSEPPVLLVLGRKGHRKGTDLLRDLVDPDLLGDARLWVVGDEEPRELSSLHAVHEELVGRWGSRLRWSDAEQDVTRVLDQASVLLLPSRAEARPRVVEEALAHGVPVITSPLPGVLDIGETVTHPGALTIVPLGEPWNEAIQDALRLDLPNAPLIVPFSETAFADAWLRVLREHEPSGPAGLSG